MNKTKLEKLEMDELKKKYFAINNKKPDPTGLKLGKYEYVHYLKQAIEKESTLEAIVAARDEAVQSAKQLKTLKAG